MAKEIKNRISQFISCIEDIRHEGFSFGEFTKKDFENIAFFIEKKLPQYIEQKKHYLKKEETGLPCPVQYDPLTKKIFIHLETNKGMLPIGKGGQKTVTTTIEYARKPKILANAEYVCHNQNELIIAQEEVQVVNQLKGKKGILKVVTCLENYESVPRINIISKFYNQGSLTSFIHSNNNKLKTKQVTKIIKDVFKGVSSSHGKGFVHLDIKPDNIFIEKSKKKGKFKAVLADFGCAQKIGSIFSCAHATGQGFAPPFVDASKGLPNRFDINDQKRLDLFPTASSLSALWTHKIIQLHDGPGTARENELRTIIDNERKNIGSFPKKMKAVANIVLDMMETGLSGEITEKKADVSTYLAKVKSA